MAQLPNPPQNLPETNLLHEHHRRQTLIISCCFIAFFLVYGVVMWLVINTDSPMQLLSVSRDKVGTNATTIGAREQPEQSNSTSRLPSPTVVSKQISTAPTSKPQTVSQAIAEARVSEMLVWTGTTYTRVQSDGTQSADFSPALTRQMQTGEKATRFAFVSPSSEAILMLLSRTFPDHTNVTGLNRGNRYFLVSVDGSKAELIDDRRIVNAFKESEDVDGDVEFHGWSINSRYLVGYITYTCAPDRATGKYPYKYKGAYITYDTQTQAVQKILAIRQTDTDPESLERGMKPLFYDSDKQIIVFSQAIAESKIHRKLLIMNLQNQGKQLLFQLTMDNSYQSLPNIGMATHPYFVQANTQITQTTEGQFSFTGRKELTVHSYIEPERTFASIAFEGSSKLNFEDKVLWARDGSYFVVATDNADVPASEEKRSLQVYARDGTLLSTPLLDPYYFVLWGAVASDGAGIAAAKPVSETSLMILHIDPKTGAIVKNNISFSGAPLFWYRN